MTNLEGVIILNEDWHTIESSHDIWCSKCGNFVDDIKYSYEEFKCVECNMPVPESIIKKFNFMFPDDQYIHY